MTTITKKKITILGSTGSIGVSSLDVIRRHPNLFSVECLAAGSNTKVLLEQIKEFKPKVVSVRSEKEYAAIKNEVPSQTELLYGDDAATQVADYKDVDLVISAIVGAAGLKPTLKAIENKKAIGLANKESMVVAGEIMSLKALENNVPILPVDSEHSAIFQCLNGESVEDVKRLVLTASGGPFLHTPQEEFVHITKERALKHPNWDMGAKITIDSASMMNKGLEVMEAHWLFNMPVNKINVVVHPQSIIHSMVEFVDSSVMAQMGEPDMRVPIAYALTYPRRIKTGVKELNLPNLKELTFFEPDYNKFKCLKLAFEVSEKGKTYPPVLNAANEVAVEAFLKDKICFIDIPNLIDKCVQAHESAHITCIEDVLEADRWAREFTNKQIGK